ncbi:MAG: SLC13 family permease, partial [Chloroflexota bacterium]|nr:SLC13 family permease [Chloroflexota bacterium]
MTTMPFRLDHSQLKVYRTPWEVVRGGAGYRPIILLLAVAILLCMSLLPIPGGLLDLVESPNVAGYYFEGGTDTIVDSTNYHKHPQAFEQWQESGGPIEAQDDMDSSKNVARMAMIMVGILFVAAMLWGTEALPIGGTVILVAALMYGFGVLSPNEITKAFMKDAVFFIFGILAVAVGVSKTGLDKRIGLLLLSRIKSAWAFALVFFPMLAVAAGFLSEHALVALLIPVMMGVYKATCIAHGVKTDRALAIFLILGLCFAANVGGPGSPAAGGRNAIMVGYLADAGHPIDFVQWVKCGLPLVPVLALAVGIYMYIRCKPKFLVSSVNPAEVVKREVKRLPAFGGKEAIMTGILVALILAWILLDDVVGLGGATIIAVLAMFLTRLITWNDLQSGVAFDVVGLYAAACAMGVGLAFTGGALWLANTFVDMLPAFMNEGNGLTMGVSILTGVMTNFMSDGATVGALGPIVVPMAELGNVSVWKVGLICSFASSFANVL